MTNNLLVLFIILTFSPLSYGYLDGGSASMLLQLLLGGFAVVGGLLNMYWQKVKSFFSFNKKDDSDNTPSKPDGTESENTA